MKQSWRADLALVIVSLVWGTTFVIVKQALQDVSTLLFLALRFTLGTVVLWIIFRGRRSGATDTRSEWLGGLLSGGFLFTGYALQTWGLELTTPSKSAFLTGLYIVLVPLLGALVYKKRPHPSEWLGVLVAAAGVVLLTVPDVQFHVGLGDALTIGCAVAYAGQVLVLERFSRRGSFERLAMIQIGTVAAAAGATCWWVEKPRIVWSVGVVSAVLITGLAATALAFAAQTWAQARTTATHAAVIFSLEPAFGAATSVLAGVEPLTLAMLGGSGLILGGIALAELKPVRFGEHP